MQLMIRVFALMLVLMFGIFLGIDTAERNIQNIQGSQGATRAVQITPNDEGRVEIAVLGHVYETETPPEEPEEVDSGEKEEKAESTEREQVESDNWLAEAGNQTGTGMRKVSRKVLDYVVGLME
ncbi:DUF3679 domain-containing protein [Paludifilum halophilum]|uniref:DUF3679 domain-containing protein n=1 Tax=Paludifilum halophilum TaxID=1642702 RepID=A0A235B6Z2_9BACL|nr:DUF3679 domain-containing protein [Paludifilum halophilum]OYD07647.1 hypothetical protein CHM34_09195 [Paludifilum halophilum]